METSKKTAEWQLDGKGLSWYTLNQETPSVPFEVNYECYRYFFEKRMQQLTTTTNKANKSDRNRKAWKNGWQNHFTHSCSQLLVAYLFMATRNQRRFFRQLFSYLNRSIYGASTSFTSMKNWVNNDIICGLEKKKRKHKLHCQTS